MIPKWNHKKGEWKKILYGGFRTGMMIEEEKPEVTNEQFAKTDEHFQTACEKAGVEPTSRQASKWRNGKGIAREVI